MIGLRIQSVGDSHPLPPFSTHAASVRRHPIIGERCPSPGRRQDTKLLAVLGHRPARDVDADTLQRAGDLLVAQGLPGILGLHQRLDLVPTDSDDTTVELSLRAIPLWKKYFNSNTPCGVWAYLLDVARLTVDGCMSISDATSRNTSGLRPAVP